MTMLVSSRALAALSVGLALLMTGCASPSRNAIFVTKSSMSFVEADSTPASLSIGYDRIEGYMGPRYPDGTIFPVASAIESSGTGASRLIKQVYATGNAARIATAQQPPNLAQQPAANPVQPGSDDRHVVFFGTSTSVGLKLGFAEGTPVPNAFNLGYKRKEFSVIPVDPGREPSVLGTFNNAAGVARSTAAGTGTFQVEQYFATGEAADNLASLGSVRDRFVRKAEEAIGDVQKFRVREAVQGRAALDIVACLTKVPDARVPEVWVNARHLGIFRDLGAEGQATGKPAAVQRNVYMNFLPVALDPDSNDYSDALAMHKKVVCSFVPAA